MQANCPICFETVGTTNCVVTECGHTFHSNCLMRNVAYNGFGCPYCRTEMATVPKDEESDDSEYEETNETEDDTDEETHLLRGLRFFNNHLNGEPHDINDIRDELNYYRLDVKPTIDQIAEKIMEDGVTIKDFIKAMLKDVNEYEEYEDEYDNLDEELFEKLCNVIVQYQLTV